MAESNKWPEAKNLEFIRRWNAGESRAVLGREYKLKNPREKARYLAGRGYDVIMPMAANGRVDGGPTHKRVDYRISGLDVVGTLTLGGDAEVTNPRALAYARDGYTVERL